MVSTVYTKLIQQILHIWAPAHNGIALLKFIANWVVGLNVWGTSPRRFVDRINIIREIIISVHVHPFGVWISIFLK